METSMDRIEQYLRGMKHTTWGFVIYRSTYTSDNEFASFIASIRTSVSASIVDDGAETSPTAQQLSWKIIEDQSRLDGASKAEVRRLFDEWCRSTELAAEQPEALHPVAESQNARYRFCVQIDKASLDSFKTDRDLWVNLIMRRWPYGPDEDENANDDDQEEDEEEEEDDGLEKIEGSTEEDVGWCKVRTISLQPSCFSNLCGPNAWYLVYQRPPLVAW
jgi:hypothetical protein